MALLRVMIDLQSTQPVFHDIAVFTFDHGLRAESSLEAQRVHTWCQELGLPHILRSWHTSTHPHSRLQEQARHARYQAFLDVCHEYDAAYMMTAHHEDDQLETFWMRLFKGSGIEGLCAMQSTHTWRTHPPVTHLRPFLHAPKSLIESYMESYPFIQDPSNTNTDFERIRIRQLIHTLRKQGFSMDRIPTSIQHIQSTWNVLCQEFEAINDWITPVHDGCILDLTRFKTYAPYQGILALRRLVSHIAPSQYPITFEQATRFYDNIIQAKTFTLHGFIWRWTPQGYRVTAENRHNRI